MTEGSKLGRMQLQIMQVLWDRGRASAREITDALNRSESEATAHSTVQTLLRQLEAKGAVGHEVQDRVFLFFAKLEEKHVKRSATRDVIDRVFGGDAGELVKHLIRHETISREELDELRGLIDRLRTATGAAKGADQGEGANPS